MIQITQLHLSAGTDPKCLETKIRKNLRLKTGDSFVWEILRHSVDARKKAQLLDVYTAGVRLQNEKRERALVQKLKNPNITYGEPSVWRPDFTGLPSPRPDLKRPVIVGFGPAGIFAAYVLAEAGQRPIVLERGSRMDQRISCVMHFRETGVLNPRSNIQFGEGGAGTFSDGKLSCGSGDNGGYQRYVLETFVRAGAPHDILTEQLPHIGTDLLRGVIVRLRKHIEEAGGEIRFDTCMTGLEITDGKVSAVRILSEAESDDDPQKEERIETDTVILAVGHSARDTFRMLYSNNVPMQAKNFAVGFRVSHPQAMINEARYGISDPERMKELRLPPASYKLTYHTKEGRSVYSFCMCPGGYVVNASSEPGKLAVNGMSDYARDSARANSAIVMGVGPDDFADSSVFGGMHFQEMLETQAFELAEGKVPVESYGVFKSQYEHASEHNPSYNNKSNPLYRALSQQEQDCLCLTDSAAFAPLHSLLPKKLTEAFLEGMEQFETRIRGFTSEECYVIGLESRTSSPVRILRDETRESAIAGLYPTGEGAGYAGGIMSAATDGIRTAEQILKNLKGR